MDKITYGKSRVPLQLKIFHTLVGLSVFFSLITVPGECQIIGFFGLSISSDQLWWSIVFFNLYLIHNIYGFSYLRHVVYLIIFFRFGYILFLQLAIWLPSSVFWKMQDIYIYVLGRSWSYILKSSMIFGLCILIPIKFIKNPLKSFIISVILFSLSNTVFLNQYFYNYLNNFIGMFSFFIILSAFSKKTLRIISDIEKIKPDFSDYSIFKFNLPICSITDKKIFKYHHILFCSSIIFFIASKTMASKFISIGFFTINVGGIVFSLAYLITDIMTDVYGIERTKQMVYFLIFSNLLFVFDIWFSNLLAIEEQTQFKSILTNQTRMFIASGIAFFLGMTINSSAIAIIKSRQRKRHISLKKEFLITVWTRIATSSSMGIILDVSLFSFVAFYGVVPTEKLGNIIIFEDTYKIFYEILLAPVSVLLIYILKTREQVDIYDDMSNLNPFIINTDYKINANRFYENFSNKNESI